MKHIWKCQRVSEKIVSTYIRSSIIFQADYKEEWEEKREKIQEKCQEQTSLEDDKLENIKENGEIDESDETELNFSYCLATEANLVDKDGNVKMDVANEHFKNFGLSDDVVKKAHETCKKIDKPDEVPLLIARLHNCYRQYVPEEALVI